MGSLADLCASEVIVEKIDKAYEDGYNKAIEEFAERLRKESNKNIDRDLWIGTILHIAKEMKGE